MGRKLLSWAVLSRCQGSTTQAAAAPLLTAVSRPRQRSRRAAPTPQTAAEWHAELHEEETPHPRGPWRHCERKPVPPPDSSLPGSHRPGHASVTGLPAGCSGSQAAATEDSTDPVPPHSSTCHWRGVRGSAGGRGAPARTVRTARGYKAAPSGSG